jgi:predicted kinase
MGLPGAGKTTLANALVPLLGAVHFNADKALQLISATPIRREILRA